MYEVFFIIGVFGAFFLGVCIGNEADARAVKAGFFKHNDRIYRVRLVDIDTATNNETATSGGRG